MPDRPRGLARVAVALGFSLLLLTDLPAAWPGGAAMAATAAPDASAAPGAVAGVSAVEDAVACTPGFGDTDNMLGLALHGVTLTGGGALAVGFFRAGEDDDFGRRRPAALFNLDDRWTRVSARTSGMEDGLVAVTAAGHGDAMAVGFTTIRGVTMPLAMRWADESWREDRPRPASPLASLFTDVAMDRSSAIAVGYRLTSAGRSQPLVARHDRRGWRYVSPATGPRESVSLTGAAPDRRGGLWVVGYGGPGAELQPVIYRRANSRWTRLRAPHLPGEAVLTDVVATGRDEAWAVGYQQSGGRIVPLVLRWDGQAWSRAEAPSVDSPEVLLTAVSAAPTGGVWVVGAAWDAALASHEAIAAWWDGRAWSEVAGPEGGTELHDVVGSLDGDGWAVGRDGLRSSTARVCLPAQSGIFGGSEPTVPRSPTDNLAAGDGGATPVVAGSTTAVITVADPASGADGDAATEAEAAGTATTTAPAAGKTRDERRPRPRQRGGSRRRGPAALPGAGPDQQLIARDVASEVGIAERTGTYGAVVADFDGDGVADLYIGRHGRPGRLLLNRDGRFVDHTPVVFPTVDRHGCAAADIDGSGLPDLFCAVGGKRGSGLKSNELWLDPGGPAPAEVAIERGLSDPTGRGRRSAFLESRGSGQVDLVVTNAPLRVDGLPSISRLLRTRGDGRFRTRPRTGYADRLGSLSLQDADYDRDGREDLLLVTGGLQAPKQEGSRLYRNTPRGLVDVTRRMGVRSMAEVDAKLVDLDGDRRLDLVQLSPTRLRVSLQRNGRFRKVYERRLTWGRAVAGGDVNGDGHDDLYIVRANSTVNHPDLMLVNRRSGKAWSSLTIPQAAGGNGDEAYAIDHDGNGLDDFLVLNGNNARGPTQLIAFFRPGARPGS